MQISRNLVFLAAVLGWNFYFALTSYGILNNNEGLYAQIAWEMLARKDFVIPFLNGVPYIEKPPMLYWLIAGAYSLVGKSDFAARFIPASFGMLTCVSLYLFCARVRLTKTAFMAATILGSSLGFVIFSRMVFFDVVLTAFFTFATLCFYLWDREQRKLWLRLGYVFAACALLTKGFLSIALIGLIFLIFFMVKYRNLKWVPGVFDPLGIFIFLAISVPWHVMASLNLPEFAWFYFINEHVLRFLDMRVPRDYYRGPFYYYLIRIPAYFVPWTFIAPWLMKGKISTDTKLLKTFLWIWFLVLLGFFTLSRAKANYYMVLGMPPLALLIGLNIHHHLKSEIWVKIGALISVFILFGGALYVRQVESDITERPAINVLRQQVDKPNLYLFRRYELISSALYYYDKRVPIIDSDSKDLWFGSTTPYGQGWFIKWNDVPKDKPLQIMAHKKDWQDFEKLCPCCAVIYTGTKTRIYQMG